MRCLRFFKSTLGFVLSLFISMGLLTTPVYAVDGNPPGLFQLDGDPNEDNSFGASPANPLPGDDWETLWLDCMEDPRDPLSGFDPYSCGNAEVFSGIIPDFYDPFNDPTTFAGGGSKDPEDISGDVNGMKYWLYKDGTVQDKNEINNGFAAAYLVPQYCVDGGNNPVLCDDASAVTDPGESCWDDDLAVAVACDDASADFGLGDICVDGSGDPILCREPSAVGTTVHADGDLIIYFGADRHSNDGDAYMGFWFLQDDIGLTDINGGGGFEFSGVHKPGDILVLARFPQNSTGDPRLSVLTWIDPLLNGGDTLDTLFDSDLTGDPARCDGFGNKLACAVTNAELGDNPNPPQVWPYTPKANVAVPDGPDGPLYPYETFVSGGINVTQLLQGQDVCISSLVIETRASKTFSETSTLSDFVLGKFQLCNSEAVTTIHAGSNQDATPHTVIKQSDEIPAPTDNEKAVVGDTIHDSVTVTGTALGSSTAPDPVGDVTFILFDNATCSPESDSDGDGYPDDPATDANVLDVSTGTLVAGTPNDGISTAESGDYQLTATGGHCYRAFWDGDTNFPTGAISGKEPFDVIQPKLQITKDVNSCLVDDTQDSGSFTMQYALDVASPVYANAPNGSNLKDGGSTGYFGVYPGSYLVNEVAGTKTGGGTTDLNEYVKLFPPIGECAGGSVTLTGNDQKSCTIVNVRKPHLIINKVVVGTVPTGDGGVFDLQVNGTTVDSTSEPTNMSYISGDGSDVGDGGVVRVRADVIFNDTVDPADFGSFVVGEVAGTNTDINKYQTSIICDDTDQTEAAFPASTDTGRTVSVDMSAGMVVTCTITNIAIQEANDCPVQ